MSALAETNPTIQSEPKTNKVENGGYTTDVHFSQEETELTLYIRPNLRRSVDVTNMGLPQEMVNMMDSEEFWKSKMAQVIEHKIIAHMAESGFLYIGYKGGYFVGFDCIPIIKYLNDKINKTFSEEWRKIKHVIVSNDIGKPEVSFAVRGSIKKLLWISGMLLEEGLHFKPTTTKKVEVGGPDGIKVEKEIDLLWNCELIYNDNGQLERNISTMERTLWKKKVKIENMEKEIENFVEEAIHDDIVTRRLDQSEAESVPE